MKNSLKKYNIEHLDFYVIYTHTHTHTHTYTHIPIPHTHLPAVLHPIKYIESLIIIFCENIKKIAVRIQIIQ